MFSILWESEATLLLFSLFTDQRWRGRQTREERERGTREILCQRALMKPDYSPDIDSNLFWQNISQSHSFEENQTWHSGQTVPLSSFWDNKKSWIKFQGYTYPYILRLQSVSLSSAPQPHVLSVHLLCYTVWTSRHAEVWSTWVVKVIALSGTSWHHYLSYYIVGSGCSFWQEAIWPRGYGDSFPPCVS